MADSYDSRFLDDPEFQSLLVGCLESLQRGETIDRGALARDFSKYADAIGQFLSDRQLLEQVASSFGDIEPSRVAISAYERTVAAETGTDDFATGDTIRYIGEYEILEEIARGGMGVVFKARQQTLRRTVALKMILAGRLADGADIERFRREARAAGRLRHPGIVSVHEIGEHDGRHYLTMDFVAGQSLADAIREETLAPRMAAELVRTAAEAVQYAHEQGTVHRDLKPANILLDADRRPHITDFGLAKLLEAVDDDSRVELTASGQILGTPSYMAPEQAAGKQDLVGPASDIYSLGAILYASLTGRAPFVADSPVDTLLQVIKKEPVSPRELNPSVPRDLETICLKCLTKEPHKRYGTARELAEDLQRFLEGRAVVARPIDSFSKLFRWARRNRAIASLLLLAFVLLVGGTIISSYFAIEANRRARAEASARLRADNARKQEIRYRKQSQQMTDFAMAQQSQAQLARDLAEQQRQRAEAERLAAIKARDAEAEARQDAEQARAQAERLFKQEAEARMQAERAERDVVRSLYVARTHLTRLLWERGDKWGASLPHVEQLFENDLTLANPDPAIELETLNHMIAAAPSDDFLHFLRGIYYAKRRQWKESFADLELASNLTSNQYWYHCEAASVALMVENHEAYDRHVQSLVNHVKGSEQTDVLSGANVALIAALRPQAPELLAPLMPFTERWASSRSNQFFRMKSLILMRLRLGEFEAALKLLAPFSDDANFHRTEHIVLAGSMRALALYHLGRFEEAARELDSAVTVYADRLAGDFDVSEGSLQATHHPFIQAHVLLSEARKLIESDDRDARLDAIDDFTEPPSVVQTLLDKLHSNDSDQRVKALQELAELGYDAATAVPHLERLLKQRDSYEKILVIRCLARIGPAAAAAVPTLHDILRSETSSAESRFEAGQALAHMGTAGEVAIPMLIAIVEDPGPSEKSYIRSSTAREALGLMAPLLREDDMGGYTDQRDIKLMHAIVCLGLFGTKAEAALPAMQHVRDDETTLPFVKRLTTEAIRKIKE